MNDCRRFILETVAAADATACNSSPEERARALARWLVGEHVPAMYVFGVDLRRALVGRKGAEHLARSAENEPPGPDAAGFRSPLTAGGQDGEVVRHLAAAAAAVLMNREFLVAAASALDRAQGVLRDNPAEARAEVEGNRAGAALGTLLLAYLKGDLTRAALVEKMQRLLCGG